MVVCCFLQTCNSVVNMLVMRLVLGPSLKVISITGVLLYYAKVSLLYNVFNPRRACARVTLVVSCVCLSVIALAASVCVHSGHKRYTRVSRRPFLDLDSWIFEKC